MSVSQIYSHYPPIVCYAVAIRVVTELSNRLAKHDHDVTVYTTDAGSSPDRIVANNMIQQGNIIYYHLDNINDQLASQASVPLSPIAVSTIGRLISNFDILHVHGHSHLLSIVAANEAHYI